MIAFGQIQSALGITTLYSRKWLEIVIQGSSRAQNKVSQKLYYDKLCEVLVLKELVDGTLERDFTKATHASIWSW